jgi:hypothetical protein
VFSQAGGKNVPKLAMTVGGRVKLCAEQRRKPACAKWPRVGYREAVLRLEMIRQAQEIVSRFAVDTADLLRSVAAVGTIRVRVDVATPEFSGRGEGLCPHGTRVYPPAVTMSRRAAARSVSIGASAPLSG